MVSLERSIWRWEEAFRGDDNRFKFLKDWVCKTSKVGYMCLKAEVFPGGSDGKKSACKEGDLHSVPWRRKWQSTPVFLPGKSHGWRSLAGYSAWGCKELDTTKQLTL